MEPGLNKILVIEDDNDLRETLCMTLRDEGYNVAGAADGKQGAMMMKEFTPELVITDILMPEKDGLEIIMMQRKEMPHVRVIAISGGCRLGPQGYLETASVMGAKKTLIKPFSMDELKLAIHDVFREQG